MQREDHWARVAVASATALREDSMAATDKDKRQTENCRKRTEMPHLAH